MVVNQKLFISTNKFPDSQTTGIQNTITKVPVLIFLRSSPEL